MEQSILVISNPISGDGKGSHFVAEHILPLLKSRQYQYEFKETTKPGHAGQVAAAFLQTNAKKGKSIVIIISGGDGTVHEVVNGIGIPSLPLQLVICPQGTANALYSALFPPTNTTLHNVDRSSETPGHSFEDRLKSVDAFIQGKKKPLILAQTSLINGENVVTDSIFSIVVTSTALHASILDTAEHLRSSVRGVERFKVAAMENISNWYGGQLQLLSEEEKPAKSYDSVAGTFIQLEESQTLLAGPFAYLLSTVNVDRLEPSFEITPLFSSTPSSLGEMDMVVIRPLRDPALGTGSQADRAAFVPKLINVLQSAYVQGSHVSLRYDQGNGPCIVEYIRCNGWRWIPDVDDDRAHLVCVDGTILKIPTGGAVDCKIFSSAADTSYFICA
ncbi:ATP-NAD kinase-like domain-containing protein [Hysterangium stoloniferum]|nr:ATP-NAD kinase-like domain-containing protein [Hysterangium stoloniferum]